MPDIEERLKEFEAFHSYVVNTLLPEFFARFTKLENRITELENKQTKNKT